jgi:hypothetical protein
MRSVQLQAIYDLIEKRDVDALAIGITHHRDKRYRTVAVSLKDGSTMLLRNSYVETINTEDHDHYVDWYVIFSEHYDNIIFHEEDVLTIVQYGESEEIQEVKF